jgi:hypothetical protein
MAKKLPGSTSRILYIECKTGGNDRGLAVIGRVAFSKTGKTIRYRDLELRSLGGQGISANYFDAKTGLQYWVSGPKKNGKDRHWAGGGPVHVDEDVAEEYWHTVRKCEPPKNPYVA